MIDDPAQTWIELPPAPPATDAVRAIADEVVATLASRDAVTLVGSPGSGRRTAALHAAHALDPAGYLVPALPWRAPGALREIARRLGVPTPVELSPRTIVTTARGAMDGHRGTLVLDARVRAEGGLLHAITPPGWRTILLVPDDSVIIGERIDLPAAPPPPLIAAGDDATVYAAASLFDPWEGAPRSLLSATAGLDEEHMASAISRLLEVGALRPARDRRRVMPTLHAHLQRPEPTAPTIRAIAERFVETMASWCLRAGDDARHQLADDRGNLMTSLAIWQEVAPVDLVDGFAFALPMLLDDTACHQAAKLVIQATRFAGDRALALGADANRRMSWSA